MVGVVEYSADVNNSRLALFLETHLDNPEVTGTFYQAMGTSAREFMKMLDARSMNYVYQSQIIVPEGNPAQEKALVDFVNLYNRLQGHDVPVSNFKPNVVFSPPSRGGSATAP